jgi:hypothetical protein
LDEASRKFAENQLNFAVENALLLSKDEPVPVTIHSSSTLVQFIVLEKVVRN